MPFFSLSVQRPARVSEAKSTFNRGELAPSLGQSIQLRVDESAYSSRSAFEADLNRLLQRIRELGEPRPEFVVDEVGGIGEPWSDGTFWSDGTGWAA